MDGDSKDFRLILKRAQVGKMELILLAAIWGPILAALLALCLATGDFAGSLRALVPYVLGWFVLFVLFGVALPAIRNRARTFEMNGEKLIMRHSSGATVEYMWSDLMWIGYPWFGNIRLDFRMGTMKLKIAEIENLDEFAAFLAEAAPSDVSATVNRCSRGAENFLSKFNGSVIYI